MPLTSPLITPQEVIEYTDNQEVKVRPPEKLKLDIVRSESKIFSLCGKDFLKESTLPEPIRIALILYAEYYAIGATINKNGGMYKSESFDDYSYELRDETIAEPDVYYLIEPYVVNHQARNKVELKLRRL